MKQARFLSSRIIRICLKGLLLILAGCLLLPGPELFADYDDMGVGARSIGMGYAFTALSDDAFGMFYNPAGLGFIRQAQVGADYGRLWLGLDDDSNLNNSFLGIVVPYFKTETVEQKKIIKKNREKDKKKKNAKENVLNLLQGKEVKKKESRKEGEKNTSGKVVKLLNHWGTFGAGWKQFSLYGYYQESAYYISFGKNVKQKWAYGVNLKFLSEKYTVDDYIKLSPVFDYGAKNTVTNYSADAGLMYNIMPRFFAGFAVNDINQPDLGLKQEDKLPSTYRFGLGWRQRNVKWGVDTVYRDAKWYGAVGAERWFKKLLGLRAGLNFGGKNYISAAFGFSLDFTAAQLDYAFQMPFTGIKDTSGSHRVSIVYRFGRRPKEELEPGSLELYYANLQEEMAALKHTLSEVQTEKKKLEEVLIEESTLRIRERIRAAKAEAHRTQKEQTSGPKIVKHLVKKGDTLQSISKKYYKDEKYWNKIYQANKESVGIGGILKERQVLVIPPLSAQSNSVPSITTTPKPAAVPVKTIEQGVPLIKVTPAAPSPAPKARKPSVPIKKDISARKKSKPSRPKKHVVKPGENLQSIAKKYYNDSKKWKDIYKANKSKVVGGQIAPGTEITIP